MIKDIDMPSTAPKSQTAKARMKVSDLAKHKQRVLLLQGGGALGAPLWNRRVPDGATYTPYTSASLDAQAILDGLNAQPGGSSKLRFS